MPLDPRTATSDVLAAMQSTIALALRKRLPAVADVAALRAFPTLGSGTSSSLDGPNLVLVPVTGGAVWQWSEFSTATDDDAAVVRPTDRATRPGRWLATSSTSATGYLRAVRIYSGDESEAEFIAKLSALAPSVGIVWREESNDRESGIPGAFYRMWMAVEVWALSRCLRSGNEALMGSQVPSEAALDPGVLRIVGDLRAAVGGSNLGLPDGIDYCYPGAHRQKFARDGERQFVHSLAVRIPVTLRFEDAAGEDFPADAPGTLRLQDQWPDTAETLHDLNPGDPDVVPPA